MKSSRRVVAVVSAAVLVLVLGLPGTASADHVSATLSVSAKLGERVGNSRIVEVQWSIVCNGASDPLYFGNLYLDDQGSGESIYMGGTSGSGTSTVPVSMEATPRTLKPRLRASCASGDNLHGSGTQEVLGNEVVVPALNCDPDLLAQALREYETGASFYRAASSDLRRAHDEYVEARDAWVAQELMIGEALNTASGSKALSKGSKAFILVRVIKALEEIGLKLIPTIRETRRVFKAAREDTQRGDEWSKRGEASLEAALAEGPCVGPLSAQLDQALEEQRTHDAARALVERWENNGYLYLDPATGELVDERAALRKARELLAGGPRRIQLRTDARKPRADEARMRRRVIAKLTLAHALNKRVRGRVRRADTAAEELRTQLGAVIR